MATQNTIIHLMNPPIQYNAAVATFGATRGTSFEKLDQELGLESPRPRRWLRKLCLICKICKNKSVFLFV